MATGNESKTVLVTGAATGIGRAVTLDLAGRGWRVFAGVRKDEDGRRLVATGGSGIVPLALDVTDAGQVESASHALQEHLRGAPLHGLVNNAGIAVGGPLEFLAVEELRRQFEVNLFGLLAVTQACLPLLRRAPAGQARVVNIGSVSGLITKPFLGPYSASKFAVEALTDALRRELLPWKIEVSVIEAGPVATPIWDKAREQAQARRAAATGEAVALYGERLDRLSSLIDGMTTKAIPVERMAGVVRHALTARRPHTRYLIGPRGTAIEVFLGHLLPDRWIDALVAKRLG